jgi:hypothetical protein
MRAVWGAMKKAGAGYKILAPAFSFACITERLPDNYCKFMTSQISRGYSPRLMNE